jgi:uncharacterized membrane protein YkvA (DUF1232 family)
MLTEEEKKAIDQSEKKIAKSAKKLGKSLPVLKDFVVIMKEVIQGKRKISPLKAVIITGAIVYFVNPFDAMPDPIFIDDIAVIILAAKQVNNILDEFRIDKKKEKRRKELMGDIPEHISKNKEH